MKGIGKRDALKRLRGGELVYRRTRMEGNHVRTLVAVVPDTQATYGQDLHGITFTALAPLLAVRLKRVNGVVVPPETVPSLEEEDNFETYYGLKEAQL